MRAALLSIIGAKPEMVKNGGFAVDAAEWTVSTATVTIVDGKVQVEGTSVGVGFIYQAFTVKLGRTYRVKAIMSGTSSAIRFRVGTSPNGNQLFLSSGAATVNSTFLATASLIYITVADSSATTGDYAEADNISLKLA